MKDSGQDLTKPFILKKGLAAEEGRENASAQIRELQMALTKRDLELDRTIQV